MSIAFICISEESSWSLNIFSFSSASTAALRSIKKHQAIEMAFTLFPPLGAKVKNIITVPLPWVHPLIDGKDGSKKLGKNFNPSEGYECNQGHEGVVLSTSSIRNSVCGIYTSTNKYIITTTSVSEEQMYTFQN